jgi:hypothetical protein
MKIVYSRRMRISLPDHKVNSTGRERKKEQKGEGEKERKYWRKSPDAERA